MYPFCSNDQYNHLWIQIIPCLGTQLFSYGSSGCRNIVSQLTSKCYFYLWFPHSSSFITGERLLFKPESQFPCLLVLLSYHLLQAANYLTGATREGAGGQSSFPFCPCQHQGKGGKRSLFWALSMHKPSLQRAFKGGQGGCLDWTTMLAWHLSRKRITGNVNSQGLQSRRGLSWDLSSAP